METLSFRSNGKLLLSGEYLVLYGAEALAIPLRYGQTLDITTNNYPILAWTSHINNKPWFNANYSIPGLNIISTNEPVTAQSLQTLFRTASYFNPGILNKTNGYQAVSNLEFDLGWGWGSSSSLIANLSLWLKVDPFELHNAVSKGSGYDIASARSTGPIIYKVTNRQPAIRQVAFNPPFKENLFFVYSGKKQVSHNSIAKTLKRPSPSEKTIEKATVLTKQFVEASTLEKFEVFIREHEELLARFLNQKPIKTDLFSDFSGEVKSLGAWGGDFMMVTCMEGKDFAKNYFKSKGLPIIFSYDDIVLSG
ncbi:MAG: hypothetical protein KAG99_08910 [Bacteroidales bacterium]|nr:hypothetical protein [Bacteroidales bacterium]